MSPIHPESPVSHDLQAEISAMNREFLALLTHPAAGRGVRLLGLSPDLIQALRNMSAEQLDNLAGAPLLLAGFARLPGHAAAEDQVPCQVADSNVAPEWSDCVNTYANRLLASLWHYSREPDGITGFCVGLDRRTALVMAAMSFAELGERASEICASLQARHADHPACWPDLVSTVMQGEGEKLSAAHLSLIPLTVAAQFAASG